MMSLGWLRDVSMFMSFSVRTLKGKSTATRRTHELQRFGIGVWPGPAATRVSRCADPELGALDQLTGATRIAAKCSCSEHGPMVANSTAGVNLSYLRAPSRASMADKSS